MSILTCHRLPEGMTQALFWYIIYIKTQAEKAWKHCKLNNNPQNLWQKISLNIQYTVKAKPRESFSGKSGHSKVTGHTRKFRILHTCPGQDACLYKTWEDPGFSPWADPYAQCKPDQELKEGPGTEPICKEWEIGELLMLRKSLSKHQLNTRYETGLQGLPCQGKQSLE